MNKRQLVTLSLLVVASVAMLVLFCGGTRARDSDEHRTLVTQRGEWKHPLIREPHDPAAHARIDSLQSAIALQQGFINDLYRHARTLHVHAERSARSDSLTLEALRRTVGRLSEHLSPPPPRVIQRQKEGGVSL